ncbi:NADH dehydrogenase [Thermoclostridium stercorarium subsp. leptospartum DSM 9219]|uniref:NADH dehydrogenase n=1 Tax=Thermoclostridium stercorarium subsp. leptospartum DSM 9219 TaxID=1346611 RepID=A0A1B1YNF2_THEST|nr:nitroreductase family protein [Thermoclostridium stercorarium]ANX02317.1 NADH dehydrogenase [Thermoclostridium stercorarium subsp. leptospartum DSM 9219]
MDVIDAILTRRSIRKFTGRVISDDELNVLLKAGFQAPSAHNLQPWHFVVVKDKEKLEKMAEKHPYAKMLPQSGCGIIVCGDINRETREGFLVEDCSAAIQNILFAAHGIGLGAVWCGIYPDADRTKVFSEILSLPDNIIPVGLIAVGYPNEEKSPQDRFDNTKVHYEKW